MLLLIELLFAFAHVGAVIVNRLNNLLDRPSF